MTSLTERGHKIYFISQDIDRVITTILHCAYSYMLSLSCVTLLQMHTVAFIYAGQRTEGCNSRELSMVVSSDICLYSILFFFH